MREKKESGKSDLLITWGKIEYFIMMKCVDKIEFS